MTTLDAGEPRLLDPAAEVWALEYPGILSESALAHIHRDLQEALPDKRVIVVQDGARFRPLSSLDAAWAEAEAALPDGFAPAVVPWLDDRDEGNGGHPEWTYHAYPARVHVVPAYRGRPARSAPGTMLVWPRDGYGPTSAAALLALAAALRKPVTA